VGGVDVITSNPVLDDFYPADIDSTNPYAYTRVAVLPGAQHLAGDHALKYVRSRHGDLRGDLGRSQRQQQVLIALRAKAKSLNVADLPVLASTFSDEFATSISVDRFGSLVSLGRIFDGANIRQIVLLPPYTTGAMVGEQDVLIPNWDQILPLVRETFP
jgi:anionic cell wall polymer biosynthesis LytR-Cps2A-Psr (LCP) family protein